MTAPMMPQAAPQLLPPPTPPWTPFAPRPNDGELAIATMWVKRLSGVISTVKFDSMPPEWQQALVEKYTAASQVVQASLPPQPLPKGVVIQDKVTGGNIAAEEQAALHPQAPPSAAAPPAAVPSPGVSQ